MWMMPWRKTSAPATDGGTRPPMGAASAVDGHFPGEPGSCADRPGSSCVSSSWTRQPKSSGPSGRSPHRANQVLCEISPMPARSCRPSAVPSTFYNSFRRCQQGHAATPMPSQAPRPRWSIPARLCPACASPRNTPCVAAVAATTGLRPMGCHLDQGEPYPRRRRHCPKRWRKRNWPPTGPAIAANSSRSGWKTWNNSTPPSPPAPP